MSIKERMAQYAAQLDQRTPRERVMLLVAMMAVLLLGGNALVLEPADNTRKKTESEIQNVETEIKLLRTETQLVKELAKQDPDQSSRMQITQLRRQIEDLETQLQKRLITLVPPQRMPGLLKEMLRKQPGLKLIALKNLEPAPILPKVEGEESPPELYRHTLRMELDGQYLSLLKYLKSLEALSKQVFWDLLMVETQGYPHLKVELQIHTLSLSEDLIGV